MGRVLGREVGDPLVAKSWGDQQRILDLGERAELGEEQGVALGGLCELAELRTLGGAHRRRHRRRGLWSAAIRLGLRLRPLQESAREGPIPPATADRHEVADLEIRRECEPQEAIVAPRGPREELISLREGLYELQRAVPLDGEEPARVLH